MLSQPAVRTALANPSEMQKRFIQEATSLEMQRQMFMQTNTPTIPVLTTSYIKLFIIHTELRQPPEDELPLHYDNTEDTLQYIFPFLPNSLSHILFSLVIWNNYY